MANTFGTDILIQAKDISKCMGALQRGSEPAPPYEKP
jgi:hypothetical protein